MVLAARGGARVGDAALVPDELGEHQQVALLRVHQSHHVVDRQRSRQEFHLQTNVQNDTARPGTITSACNA